MKQKILAVAAALAVALAAALPAAAAPEVDTSKAVIDNAGVLSEDTEEYITGVSISLQESCGAQIGVYTTEYIGNSTVEGYAYELFNAWGLGDADKDNGVLLLMVPGEDKCFLMPGAGIETQLTIDMLQTIMDDDFYPNWDEGDYDAAAQETVAALGERLCRIYGVTLDTSGSGGTDSAAAPEKNGIGFMGVLLILIAVALVIAVLSSLFRPRRPRGFGSNLFWYGMGRASRPRRSPPPPPPPRRDPPRPPRGGSGFGGMGGAPRSGGSFRSGGGGTRGGGVGRSSGGRSGGSFRSGGGGTRGGGVGRR